MIWLTHLSPEERFETHDIRGILSARRTPGVISVTAVTYSTLSKSQSQDPATVSIHAEIQSEPPPTTAAALPLQTTDGRLHTSSLSPDAPAAPQPVPGALCYHRVQPSEDQAWEERKEENEWRHHQFYFRLHILDERLERGCRL